MRVARYLFWMVCTAILLSNSSFAADSPPLGVYPTPPVPIAGERIVLIYRFAWIGFPVTFPKQEVQLNGNALDVTIFIERQSMNGNMGVIATSAEIDSLPSGTYHLRFYSRVKNPGDADYASPYLVSAQDMYVAPSTAATSAIEFFNAGLGHYFQTVRPDEVAALDSGVFPGWVRTGKSYRVYARANVQQGPHQLEPVCRYYGLPSAGLDTHFFSAFQSECEAIPTLFPNSWVLESPNAYFAVLPYIKADGHCPEFMVPVYRLWNARADVNHRYTTSLSVREEMILQGWIPEGYGSLGVGYCALSG